MLIFECMYFFKSLCMQFKNLRLHFKNGFHVDLFSRIPETKYYAKSPKQRKESKNLRIWEILFTKLENKYTLENEMKLKNR